MTKILKALEAAGWVDTTMGECRPGEEVVIVDNGHVRHEFITRADVTRGTVSDAKGFHWAAETPAQRPPRPEYAPGTVALITWDGQDEPMRAMRLNQDWTTVDDGYVMEGSAQPVRVLLPADQDTPTIEVTDEMVRAAAKCITNAPAMRDVAWQDAVKGARAALEAALEVEK